MNAAGANAVYTDLEIQEHSLAAELEGQSARVEQLQGTLDGASLLADNRVQAEQSTLESGWMQAESSLTDLTAQLREARVTAAQGPVDLTRLDTAAVPTYPTEPKRYVYLGLGLLIGELAGGALTARSRRPVTDDADDALVEPQTSAPPVFEPLAPERDLALAGAPLPTNGRAGGRRSVNGRVDSAAPHLDQEVFSDDH